jgi:hypothetical protein
VTRAVGHEPNVKRLFDEDWWQQAACGGKDPDIFFRPDRLEEPEAHKAWTPRAAYGICATCPVRLPCLVYSMEHHQARAYGVWAATDTHDRRGTLLEAWNKSQENVDAVLGFRRCHECRETKPINAYQKHHFAGYGRVCKSCLGKRRKDRKNSRPQANKKSRGGITQGSASRGRGTDGGASVRRASVPNEEAS